jgi:hypothetical protein
MKLKYVPTMYTNISTSIHTHGLVSCIGDFILHNPIDEHLNLQQIVSEPTTNNARTCNNVLYHHIKLQSMCIAFFLKALPHIRGLWHNISRMYVTYTKSSCVCTRMIPLSPAYASVDDLLELPFSISFRSGCFVFFTHFCRCPCSSEHEL